MGGSARACPREPGYQGSCSGFEGGVGSAAGVAGQFLLARSLRTRSRADAALANYATFLSAAHHVSLAIGDVAREPMIQTTKNRAAKKDIDPLLDRVNSALEVVLLIGGTNVRQAASRLDAMLIQLNEDALNHEFERDEWRAHRDPIMDTVLTDFRNAAADELRKLGRTL